MRSLELRRLGANGHIVKGRSMPPAPLPENESERIAALRAYGLLDTDVDPAYESFVRLAAEICDTPIALISLIDESRQWFKANFGLPGIGETPRDVAFCAHAIASDRLMEVPDTHLDPRFDENPLVTSDPSLRFYAGMPLIDADGHALGTLCTLDRTPRRLSEKQRDALRTLATSLVSLIEARKGVSGKSLERIALLNGALEHTPVPTAIMSVSKRRATTRFAFVNRAFAELFGYAATELIGKDPGVLAGPNTDREKLARLRSAISSGEPGSEVLNVYASSGAMRTIELRDRELDPAHRIASVRDLTRIHAVQDALANANLRLKSFVDNNTDAVFTLGADGTCLDANAAAANTFGASRDALLEFGYLSIAPDGLFADSIACPSPLRDCRTIQFDAAYRHRDGSAIDAECTAIPIVVRGQAHGAYVVARDVTERTRFANFVDRQAKRIQALYRISSARGTTNSAQIDAALELVLTAFDMQFGYVGEVVGDEIHIRNVAGERVLDVGRVIDLDRTRVVQTLARGDVVTVDDISSSENRRPNLAEYPDWHGYISAPLSIDDRRFGAIGFLSKRVVSFNDFDRDFIRLAAALVSAALERQLQKQRLNKLAYYDALTGLSNRAKFMHDLEAAIGHGLRHGRSFAVHSIDLDGFKLVNDTFGHAAGDAVLREAARRLRDTPRVYDVPARLGGDEFIVLQGEVDCVSEAEALGKRIVALLSEPYAIEGRLLDLSASVGIAIFPDDGCDPTSLLCSADVALYRAKANGKNCVESAMRFESR